MFWLDDGWRIKPRHATSKCADVTGVSGADGARIQLWGCFSSRPSNQNFKAI